MIGYYAATEESDTIILETTEAEPFNEAHERQYPREYLEGIRHFNEENYFEAHEAWEEIWTRSSGQARLFLQTLIQAAVCLHHYEQGNRRGASGLYQRVIEKFPRLPAVYMSLDLAQFSEQFGSFLTAMLKEGETLGGTETAQRPVIELLPDIAAEADLSAAASE